MRAWQSQSHVRWYCRYHVVWVPKYRKRTIFGQMRRGIGTIVRELCQRHGVELIEGHGRGQMSPYRFVLPVFEEPLAWPVLLESLWENGPLRQPLGSHRQLKHPAERRGLTIHRGGRLAGVPSMSLVLSNRGRRDRGGHPATKDRPEIRHPAARRVECPQPPHLWGRFIDVTMMVAGGVHPIIRTPPGGNSVHLLEPQPIHI